MACGLQRVRRDEGLNGQHGCTASSQAAPRQAASTAGRRQGARRGARAAHLGLFCLNGRLVVLLRARPGSTDVEVVIEQVAYVAQSPARAHRVRAVLTSRSAQPEQGNTPPLASTLLPSGLAGLVLLDLGCILVSGPVLGACKGHGTWSPPGPPTCTAQGPHSGSRNASCLFFCRFEPSSQQGRQHAQSFHQTEACDATPSHCVLVAETKSWSRR